MVKKARSKSTLFTLERSLDDFGLYYADYADYAEYQHTYTLYQLWKQSGYVCLPVAGGLLDQPADLMHDFNVFARIEAYLDLLDDTREGA